MAELAKNYDPHATEAKWYAWWEERGYFHGRADDPRPPACITIPPPNVTGTLHMGHALQHAIHDALARWARMRGHNVCVVPGVDHAGIGTQIKVSAYLYETTGQQPHEIGREAWLREAHAWAARNGGGILKQLRALGCSYDWRRERYTLDDGYYHAVLTAFRRFYERGWIYRGERLVNWCPVCQTVISDLEVEQNEVTGALWTLRYPGLNGAPDVLVTTSRPETMLGDTAVAVNPRDERWTAAHGQQVLLPLLDRPIPIVADDYPDPAFGSGAVKVTPAHDPNDWEIGVRHGLPVLQAIGPDGKITAVGGPYAGLDRYEARQRVLADLAERGLLVKEEAYTHSVPHHDRCHTAIEPLPMEQWFVKMRDLADAVLPWYREGRIQFHPDRFREYGVEWLESIRDWCISRQLWWGHRIPIYYGQQSGRVVCALSDEEARAAFGDEPYRQEEDVLDTWFSSALWPFAVLGWPDPSQYGYLGGGQVDAGSLATWHPTTWMITARDILYLWVARMAMTAQEFVGQIPFQHVVVHPTIQTKDGQRMSRSLGTGIDPLELIAQYGADATRLMLLIQCSTTQDIRFDAEIVNNQIERSATADTCRNFLNKIWNAARFVLLNLGDQRPAALPTALPELADRWIVSRYQGAVAELTAALEAYRFDEAVKGLYEFVWTEFCDWYIELAKPRLRAGDAAVRSVLWHVLEGVLRLLQPFAPFLSEEIWQQLGADGEACLVAPWPTAEPARRDRAAEAAFAQLQEVVRVSRNLRVQAGVEDRVTIHLALRAKSADDRELLATTAGYLQTLVRCHEVDLAEAAAGAPEQALAAVAGGVDVYLPLAGLVDVAAERERLGKERDKAVADLAAQRAKLGNASFVDRAPAAVVQKVRDRESELLELVARLDERLAGLSD
ncbi:MAG: valine--tRNA ligase [Fimbriimonadaceae bacterium]|nr:valine--tRNA ligase [Fimbriimonadaceae bacterium]